MKVILIILAVLIGLVALLCVVRLIGKAILRKAPEGGVSEEMYVDINGTKQYIMIYGKDRNAPVLLFLHGGPGGSSSPIDLPCMRRLADDYIVVNWDQRCSGKSWDENISKTKISGKTMVEDGKQLTEFLLKHFGRDKIALAGISWGSIFGANLILDYPQYYISHTAMSLAPDIPESAKYFKRIMLEETKDDPEMHALAEKFDPSKRVTEQNDIAKLLDRKYSNMDNYLKAADCNLLLWAFCNPYMSLRDWKAFFKTNHYSGKPEIYDTEDIVAELSIKDRLVYEVPMYLLEGRYDHGLFNMAEYAVDYYNSIQAPDKLLRFAEGGHAMPMLATRKLAAFQHEIKLRTIANDRK